MDDQHLDGNGIAGLLAEVAGADMTKVLRLCPSCRNRRPLGDHLAFRSAGVVLRCPTCADVALVIGMQDTRLVVAWRGVYAMDR